MNVEDGALPPTERRNATSLWLDDMTPAEIAAVMETTPEAARRSVFEGLRKLEATATP